MTASANPRRVPPIVDHLAGIVAVVIAWQVYVTATDAPAYMLPGPGAVGGALADLAIAGTLWRDLGFTLGNVVLGLALGSLAGFALGFALAKSPTLERWLDGPILLLQTAPKIALAPLFVIWFGFGTTSKIVLIVSLVLFPVLVATIVGLRGVPPAMIELARILKLTTWQRLRRVELPMALPEIFVGLRIGAVQAVVGAILGEWMSGKLGLGHLMTFASATYKTPMLFAAVLLTVALGIGVHVTLESAERRLLRWKQ
jgi:NitT/TauT family transport system permease protein